MIDRRTTYIDPTFTLFGSQTKIVDGVTFRRYKTGISQSSAMISDDGKIMVKQGYLNVTYTAYVLGAGPIGGPAKPKRFRDESRACAEGVALLKLIQAAQ